LLAIGDHRAVAYAMLALTMIPILDGVVVLKHADWIFKPAILIHWGTAAVMLMIVALFPRCNVASRNWRLQGKSLVEARHHPTHRSGRLVG
jgi:hypothetical protein